MDISKIKVGSTSCDVKDAVARSSIADKIGKTINTTWANLKGLRDNSQLITGQFYRITDYQCTTTQENTQSAGHQFDIIVRADDVNVLNENAYAAKHAGDTYFANSKLETWKLKYCLDNDTNRFAWADSTNGKGVIYRMIDEYNNNIPYDFKNIVYVKQAEPGFVLSFGGPDMVYSRDSSLDNSGYYGFKLDSAGNGGPNPLYTTTLDLSTSMTLYYYGNPFDYGVITSVTKGNSYVFTFDKQGSDYSLNSSFIYSNCIKPYKLNNKQRLNCILFLLGSDGTASYCNTFRNDCCNNTFRNDCCNNTFGNDCCNNTFGRHCDSNRFGNHCRNNIFLNDCSSNRFGNNCNNNTFEYDCLFNMFGNGCYNNNFYYSCCGNTFAPNCFNNILSNSCCSNSFLNSCSNNSLSYNSTFNIFGASCKNNSLGGYSNYNNLGNGCENISLAYLCFYTIVEHGNMNISLTSTLSRTSYSKIRNVKIAQGVNNSSQITKTIYHDSFNDTFQTVYQPANSQVISV